MIKFSIILIGLLMVTLSCNSPTGESNGDQAPAQDTTVLVKKHVPDYKAIKFVDDFLSANEDAIKKNTAFKEQNEALCTKKILPLIDKDGLYDDLPFELVATTTNNGLAYGNFVYEDDRYFAKVTCIIKEKQLIELKENDKYLIKFKTIKFADAISFTGTTGKIELPVVDAYLTSFTPYKK